MSINSTINAIDDKVQIIHNPKYDSYTCPDVVDVQIRFEVYSEGVEDGLGAFVDFYLYKSGINSSLYRRNIRVDFSDHWSIDDREAAIQLALKKFGDMQERVQFPILFC